MTNCNSTDYELIQQYLSGDKSKLDILINKHKNQVYSYIILVVKNRDLAEDIFQDTFIKVIRSLNIGTYKDNGKFVSWVMRIAHNLIIDYYRKNKNIQTIAEDDVTMPLFDQIQFSNKPTDHQLIGNQTEKEIRKLILQLPQEQLEIIKLRYYFDMSFKEIAKITNVSINTALGRMRYAILNLRKLMDEKQIDLKYATV